MRNKRSATVDRLALTLRSVQINMGIRNLAPEVSVSAQIVTSDVATVRAAGFRSIVCNWPDSEAAKLAGHDLEGLLRRLANGGKTPIEVPEAAHQIGIIGGASAGIAAAASLLARDAALDIAFIDPADVYHYPPAWTMVGAGIFRPATTARTIALVMPRGVHWIKAAVVAFGPERNAVLLVGCHGIDGLTETPGQNGMTPHTAMTEPPC